MDRQWQDRRSPRGCVKFRVVACILPCSAVSPVLKHIVQCIYGMLGHTWFDEADEEPTAVDKLKEGFPEPRKNDIRNGSLA